MRTFLADFDHQQRFGRNPLIIQLGLIHGSLGCYPLGLHEIISAAGFYNIFYPYTSLRPLAGGEITDPLR
jgi:hypothetical protein